MPNHAGVLQGACPSADQMHAQACTRNTKQNKNKNRQLRIHVRAIVRGTSGAIQGTINGICCCDELRMLVGTQAQPRALRTSTDMALPAR